jgi:hypothetical protein
MNENTKLLLRYVIKNKRIALFPIPTDIKNHIEVIEEHITNIRPITLKNPGCVVLSDPTLNMISSNLDNLNTELNALGGKFSKDIQEQLEKNQNSINNKEKANKILN